MTGDKHRRPDIVLLSDEEAAVKVLENTIGNLWEAVNELTRLRRTRRKSYRVTIFGSARIQRDSGPYQEVRRLAEELTRMGCDIITGGGPGLMAAANEGAVSVDGADKGRSIGIRIELPFEQNANPFVGQVYQHQTFFSRLHHFMIVSDAFIVVPGGIGTLLELSMVWQLLQVRKLYDTPLVLVGELWEELIDWARHHMLGPEFSLADEVDLAIPQVVASADEAVEIIRENRQRWLAVQDSSGQRD